MDIRSECLKEWHMPDELIKKELINAQIDAQMFFTAIYGGSLCNTRFVPITETHMVSMRNAKQWRCVYRVSRII